MIENENHCSRRSEHNRIVTKSPEKMHWIIHLISLVSKLEEKWLKIGTFSIVIVQIFIYPFKATFLLFHLIFWYSS